MALIKQVSESLTYAFDFSANLAVGETLTAAGSFTSDRTDGVTSDLSASGASVSGASVLVTLSGGTDGKTYRLYAPVTTSTGQTRVGYGELRVLKALPCDC
jgi:hypothetical protein